MSFSDRLRQARKRQGLTQEELGKKADFQHIPFNAMNTGN